MSSVAAIRTAAKTTILAAVPSLFGYNHVPKVTNLPAFVVQPAASNFNAAMGRGADTHEFDIYVLVSGRDDDLAQTELDEYVTGAGAKSIRAAVFATPSLGLSDCHAHISGMRGYGGSFNVGDVDHVGAILTLVVHTAGAS